WAQARKSARFLRRSMSKAGSATPTPMGSDRRLALRRSDAYGPWRDGGRAPSVHSLWTSAGGSRDGACGRGATADRSASRDDSGSKIEARWIVEPPWPVNSPWRKKGAVHEPPEQRGRTTKYTKYTKRAGDLGRAIARRWRAECFGSPGSRTELFV